MAVGGGAGGILWLLDLIEEHRAAIEYDWRSRFHLGLTESVPADIGWGEAIRLTQTLLADPTSHLAAAAGGHTHPFSREWTALADVFDLLAKANFKHPKPYPRPFKQSGERRHRGNTRKHPQAAIDAALRRMGHRLGPEVSDG